ncbi:MAG TPA: DUF2207 domain-containing protein [Thermoplasmatales archaeon]|nr:DUF2207 domain-containing protein [Thermoplasmatales archaeon]
MRKTFVVLFFLLLITAFFMDAMAKDYSIPSSKITFEIKPDGRVLVHEKIEYILHGCFHELYLSKPKDLTIYNASGYCENAECSFRVEEPWVSETGGRELILSLETDNCDSQPVAHFLYEVHPITLCNGTARFYYQLWGMEWNKPTDLTTTIILPGSVQNKHYYIHPWDLKYSVVMENETSIVFKSQQDAGVPFEIDMLIPKDFFENTPYVTRGNQSLSSIISFEEKSKSYARLMSLVVPVVSVSAAVSPVLLFLFCYILYGREKSVPYTGVYEREPPSAHTPAEVGTLLNQFRVPPSGFIATILNFVYKGYLDMKETRVEKQGFLRKEEVETLVFTKKREPKELRPHEQKVYNYLLQSMKNGSVSLEELKKRVMLPEFADFFLEWKKVVLSDLKMKNYLEKKGLTVFTATSTVYLILCLMLLIMNVPTKLFLELMLYSAKTMLTPALITGFVFSIAGLIVANTWRTILCRWTKEGRILELKWKNFKKFISDFTLLKEHPPASITLWDFYMVYAVALGVAEHTIKAMKDIVPDNEIRKARTGTIVYSAVGFSSINSFTSSLHSTSSGGAGGAGGGGFGGSGGGGGGAR